MTHPSKVGLVNEPPDKRWYDGVKRDQRTEKVYPHFHVVPLAFAVPGLIQTGRWIRIFVVRP